MKIYQKKVYWPGKTDSYDSKVLDTSEKFPILYSSFDTTAKTTSLIYILNIIKDK